MKELEELREIVKLVKELDKLGVLHQTTEELKAQDLTPKNNNNKFTEDEKVILRNLPENFNYIARDRDSSLLIFASKPFKKEYYWSNGYGSINMSMYNHLFQSIKWKDEEPCEFRKYL